MKSSFLVSVGFHLIILGFALFSLSLPRQLQALDVEALSVDIVPIGEFTKTIKGEKDSELENIGGVAATQKQDETAGAENIGDGDRDIKNTSEQTNKSRQSARQVNSEINSEINSEVNSEVIEQQQEPEVEAEAETPPLPENVPTPSARPQEKPQPQEDIAALINRQKESSGGLARSSAEAGLGSESGNNETTLSQSELDALRGRIQSCWNVGALVGSENAETLQAKVEFGLHQDGTIAKQPEVEVSGGSNFSQTAFASGAKRAIIQCAPYKLPRGKYDEWSEIIVYFSLKDML